MARFLPQSLRARTNLFLITGIAGIQTAGLFFHTLDRYTTADKVEIQEYQHRAFSIYQSIVDLPPGDRRDSLLQLPLPTGFYAQLSQHPFASYSRQYVYLPHPSDDNHSGNAPRQPAAAIRSYPYEAYPVLPEANHTPADKAAKRNDHPLFLVGVGLLPIHHRPKKIIISHHPATRLYSLSFLLPDESEWLVIHYVIPRPYPLDSPSFLLAFLLMAVSGGILIVWGTQRLMIPVTTLADAAAALGHDVDAAPLREAGPSEIRRAATAFNTMARRIRSSINERTLMLTALSHDLRTPITRLKLRAEFIDDSHLKLKFLSDLDEMEAMIAATSEFGREKLSGEPTTTIDLTLLLKTIVDEVNEMFPDLHGSLTFVPHSPALYIQARALILKRALTNLVVNAARYGNGAKVTLFWPETSHNKRCVRIEIDDYGNGLLEEDLERMFEPFVRAEVSRNRETGGAGLGLAIARSGVRAHGGTIKLENLVEGGLRATVTLTIPDEQNLDTSRTY